MKRWPRSVADTTAGRMFAHSHRLGSTCQVSVLVTEDLQRLASIWKCWHTELGREPNTADARSLSLP